MGGQAELTGPDLGKDGVAVSDLADGGMLRGHAGGEAVLLARRGETFHAIGASCTHYGGPLDEGLLVDRTVRCPWHHACFDLATGEALGAPALNPVPCFVVERVGARVFVRGKDEKRRLPVRPAVSPASVVVVGAGAAGNAAAEMLRRRGYEGEIALVGKDPAEPVDRPNLSKDYLAGNAPEEWIPLRGRDFYAEQKLARVDAEATAIDTKARTVALSNGKTLPYGALLLATGADPAKLAMPGAEMPHVHYLRTLADSRALIAAATGGAKRAVVIGASFIGLEVAASLRARGLEVDVVAPEARPLERVLGPELGDFVRALHEEHGVRFHLGERPARIEAASVVLSSGAAIACDLVAIGVGVRPASALAEKAGLAVEAGGIVVDQHLQTSVPGVFAAGDVARYLDVATKRHVRVEHWVHAERQGQVAAENMLGAKKAFDDPPFFWSAHYDVTIGYVGHVERFEKIEIAGSLAKRDALVAYREGGKIRAVATVGRDRQSLLAEEALRRGNDAALEALLKS